MRKALKSQLTNDLFTLFAFSLSDTLSSGQKGREEVRDILIHTSMQHMLYKREMGTYGATRKMSYVPF